MFEPQSSEVSQTPKSLRPLAPKPSHTTTYITQNNYNIRLPSSTFPSGATFDLNSPPTAFITHEGGDLNNPQATIVASGNFILNPQSQQTVLVSPQGAESRLQYDNQTNLNMQPALNPTCSVRMPKNQTDYNTHTLASRNANQIGVRPCLSTNKHNYDCNSKLKSLAKKHKSGISKSSSVSSILTNSLSTESLSMDNLDLNLLGMQNLDLNSAQNSPQASARTMKYSTSGRKSNLPQQSASMLGNNEGVSSNDYEKVGEKRSSSDVIKN